MSGLRQALVAFGVGAFGLVAIAVILSSNDMSPLDLELAATLTIG